MSDCLKVYGNLRCGKRITLLACIGADGSYMKPLVIIPRKTVDADLMLSGLTPEKVAVASQPKGFVNSVLLTKMADRDIHSRAHDPPRGTFVQRSVGVDS
jgi:hypothetical protein